MIDREVGIRLMVRERTYLSIAAAGVMLSLGLLSFAAPATADRPAVRPEGPTGTTTPAPPPVASTPWHPDRGMPKPEGEGRVSPVRDQPGHTPSDPGGGRPEGGSATGGQGAGGGGAGHAQGSPAPIAGLGFGALFAIGAGYSFLKRRVRARA